MGGFAANAYTRRRTHDQSRIHHTCWLLLCYSCWISAPDSDLVLGTSGLEVVAVETALLDALVLVRLAALALANH